MILNYLNIYFWRGVRESVGTVYTQSTVWKPFKIFLEKAIMGQLHHIPKQHRALEIPDTDVVVGLDPVMHVCNTFRSESDHPTLY
jgi:hypothetical protein